MTVRYSHTQTHTHVYTHSEWMQFVCERDHINYMNLLTDTYSVLELGKK